MRPAIIWSSRARHFWKCLAREPDSLSYREDTKSPRYLGLKNKPMPGTFDEGATDVKAPGVGKVDASGAECNG